MANPDSLIFMSPYAKTVRPRRTKPDVYVPQLLNCWIIRNRLEVDCSGSDRAGNHHAIFGGMSSRRR